MNEARALSGGPSPDNAALMALLLSVTSTTLGGAGPLGYTSLKLEIKAAVANDPFDATVVTVLGGAFLFYVAERGKNPKVESYWDALVFISTCLSVGYHDVFPKTPGGKAIAAAVQMLGPALSGMVFEEPVAERSDRGLGSEGSAQKAKADRDARAVQEAIVGTLGEILGELRAARRR